MPTKGRFSAKAKPRMADNPTLVPVNVPGPTVTAKWVTSPIARAAVDAAFFPDGRFKSNFLCNIGYGDASGLFDRSPRLSFDEACRIV